MWTAGGRGKEGREKKEVSVFMEDVWVLSSTDSVGDLLGYVCDGC